MQAGGAFVPGGSKWDILGCRPKRGGAEVPVEKFGNYRNIRMMHGETVTSLLILLW